MNATAPDPATEPAGRWLCEQLQRARFDLTTRVLPSRHPRGFQQSRGPFADYDLHYIAAGAIEYAWEGQILRARAGDFALLGPGVKFTERDPGGSFSKCRGAALIYAHFTIECGGRNPLDVLELPAVVRPPARARLGKLYRRALCDSEQSSGGAGWPWIAMKGAFVILLGAVLREGLRSGALRVDAAKLGPVWLLPVLRVLNERLHFSTLTLPELAAAAALSPSHFTHQFRRHMGLAPMQFLMQRRMALARDLLLAHPDLSIKEITQRCGFTDPYHFSAQFKRQVKQSPSDYRSRH